MPLLFQKVAGSLIRAALLGVGVHLVDQGWITSDEWSKFVAATVTVAVPLAWSIYQKYGSTLMQEALRALPAGASREAARADIGLMSAAEKVSTALAAKN